MQDVVIFGAGSVGRLAEQIILDINQEKDIFNLVGYLDDDTARHNKIINHLPVLGGLEWLEKHPQTAIVPGFSKPADKALFIKRVRSIAHNPFATLIHPGAWISNRVSIGQGSIIYPGVHIDVDIKIGTFCLLNKLVSIGHDSLIGDYSTFAPGVNLGGINSVGEGVDFGINSCSIQNINIGAWSVIGAGSVVIRDVHDNTVVVGNPAREIKSGTNKSAR